MSLFQQVFGNQGFDSNSVEPAQDFEVLPPGQYNVKIESAEVKPTKSSGGHLLSIQCSVLDGPHKGRKLFSNLNIHNANEIAQRIAMQELSSLCKAIGINGHLQSETQLVNQVAVACVKVKDDQNKIRAWKPYGQQLPPTNPPTAQQSPTNPPSTQPGGTATNSTPPWKR